MFNAVKALINWKLEHMPTYDEVDIHPLVTDEYDKVNRPSGWQPTINVDYYKKVNSIYIKFIDRSEIATYQGDVYVKRTSSGVHERFLQ